MIYPEELCLLLYFLTKNLTSNSNDEVMKDLRFQTLLDLVFSRMPELAYEYVVTTVWSLGICVSAFGLEIHPDYKLRLLTVLN